MAGSDEFKEELSRSARNKQIREEIGNDPERLAARIGGVDREKYDFDGYTDKQINMAMQGSTFDENDYARLTGKEPGGGDNSSDPKEGDMDIGDTGQTRVSIPTPVTTPPVDYIGSNISSVVGDNNSVVQNQDNSIGGTSSSDWKDSWMKYKFNP